MSRPDTVPVADYDRLMVAALRLRAHRDILAQQLAAAMDAIDDLVHNAARRDPAEYPTLSGHSCANRVAA